MTKSQPFAIKLRLFAICLVAIGCVKLGLLGLAAFDFSASPEGGSVEKTAQTADNGDVQAKLDELAAKLNIDEPKNEPAREEPKPEVKKNDEPLPQGALAAQLAAAAKPRRLAEDASQSVLPAPLVPAGPATAISHAAPSLSGDLPPTPTPLGTPLVEAGIPAPQTTPATVAARDESSLWNMLKLTSLPIPGLGSVQAAHAAALDMPAPPPLQQTSPFTPAEQLAPTGQPGITLPGAPSLPSNIPSGTSGNAPLPPRAPATLPGASVSPLAPAPSPNVNTIPPAFDPNAQNSELARQQQDILMLRQQMDERLKDIKAAEDKMKDLLREANDLEEKKVKNLIQMYANMKPRMAAQAMESMDERIAVRILSGMQPKQSGEILTYTNPAKTAKLTEMITRMRVAQ